MTLSISLSKLLKNKKALTPDNKSDYKKEVENLQLRMLRIQQGIWHKKNRVIIVFEGFDAAGKGGAIRKLTKMLDPRGFKVHPIGAPTSEEQGKHWLYRFWSCLPAPGTIAIFDRSWYGRVLVERVEGLTKKANWQRAYQEINQFEQMLINDGIDIIKIFLCISKDEQLKRFQERLKDPYKQWKLTKDDIRSRKKWDKYVEAVDDLFIKTNVKVSSWHLIPANNKNYTRKEVLRVLTTELQNFEKWIERIAKKFGKKNLGKLK